MASLLGEVAVVFTTQLDSFWWVDGWVGEEGGQKEESVNSNVIKHTCIHPLAQPLSWVCNSPSFSDAITHSLVN